MLAGALFPQAPNDRGHLTNAHKLPFTLGDPNDDPDVQLSRGLEDGL